jgi:uncharacterized protein (DUF305 family)
MISLQIQPVFRRVSAGLLSFTVALLSLAPASQATPLPAGSAPTVPPSGSPAPHGWSGMPMGPRSADAHFIVMMIPHHEGAITMAELALQRSRRPEIRALADRIRTSQSQEIEQMAQWYRKWYGSGA